MEQIKPDYYKLNIKGIECDFFDVIDAMRLSFPLGMAFKYFRIKGDWKKRISDLEKCKVCIDKEIEFIKKDNKEVEDLPF